MLSMLYSTSVNLKLSNSYSDVKRVVLSAIQWIKVPEPMEKLQESELEF